MPRPHYRRRLRRPPPGRDRAWSVIHGTLTGIGKAASAVLDPTTSPDLAGRFLEVSTSTDKTDPRYSQIMAALGEHQAQMNQLQATWSYVRTTAAQTQLELQKLATQVAIWNKFQQKTEQIETVARNIQTDTNKLGLVMTAVAKVPGVPLTDTQLGGSWPISGRIRSRTWSH